METAYTGLFAAEDRKFFLPMARIVAAEREMGGISIFEVFSQLGSSLGAIGDEVVLAGPSPATLKQCHTIIMNGLIGGGTDELEAKQLIETYCYPARPAIRDMALTWRILSATIYGIELKKKRRSRRGERYEPLRKGIVIINCATLGLDWQTASLSAYLEAREAWDEANDPKAAKEARATPPSESLKRFMKAHAVND